MSIENLLSQGWIKIEEGLFMDISDKDDCYGKLLKLSNEKRQNNRKEESKI